MNHEYFAMPTFVNKNFQSASMGCIGKELRYSIFKWSKKIILHFVTNLTPNKRREHWQLGRKYIYILLYKKSFILLYSADAPGLSLQISKSTSLYFERGNIDGSDEISLLEKTRVSKLTCLIPNRVLKIFLRAAKSFVLPMAL